MDCKDINFIFAVKSVNIFKFKDPVFSIMLHVPLLCLCLHGREASIVFQGFAFLAASIQLCEKKLLCLVLLVSLNLLY